MKLYHLRQTQLLPITLTEAWDFFSSPKNLSKITPPAMTFRILYVSGGDKAYAGQIICYKISVLPLVTFNWVTEITHVQEPVLFVDEQRSGPYALWHHQHHFKDTTDGVEIIDELHYAIPYGLLGRLVHWLFVGREVNAIFDYRTKILKCYFSADPIPDNLPK